MTAEPAMLRDLARWLPAGVRSRLRRSRHDLGRHAALDVLSFVSSGVSLDYRGAELEAQIVVFGDGHGRRHVLVCADLIWFSDAMTARLRSGIARAAGIDEAAIILSATHTHGSPQPDPRFLFGDRDTDWSHRFETAVLEGVRGALGAQAVAVRLEQGVAPVDPPVAINRRRAAFFRDGSRVGRRVQTLPNPWRPVDHRLRVLIARDTAGRCRQIIVNMACHPLTLAGDAPGADFPGELRRLIRSEHGEQTGVIFLQGHCGDIRPRLLHAPRGVKDRAIEMIIGQRFRPSQPGDSATVACGVHSAFRQAVAGARPVQDLALSATRRGVELFDDRGASTGRTLDVTAWRIGSDLTIVAASGEMLSGLAAREPGVWSVGYANGMTGYIAPAGEYAGGGYEVDGFLSSFGLTRRFAIDTGQKFEEARREALAGLGAGEGDA